MKVFNILLLIVFIIALSSFKTLKPTLINKTSKVENTEFLESNFIYTNFTNQYQIQFSRFHTPKNQYVYFNQFEKQPFYFNESSKSLFLENISSQNPYKIFIYTTPLDKIDKTKLKKGLFNSSLYNIFERNNFEVKEKKFEPINSIEGLEIFHFLESKPQSDTSSLSIFLIENNQSYIFTYQYSKLNFENNSIWNHVLKEISSFKKINETINFSKKKYKLDDYFYYDSINQLSIFKAKHFNELTSFEKTKINKNLSRFSFLVGNRAEAKKWEEETRYFTNLDSKIPLLLETQKYKNLCKSELKKIILELKNKSIVINYIPEVIDHFYFIRNFLKDLASVGYTDLYISEIKTPIFDSLIVSNSQFFPNTNSSALQNVLKEARKLGLKINGYQSTNITTNQNHLEFFENINNKMKLDSSNNIIFLVPYLSNSINFYNDFVKGIQRIFTKKMIEIDQTNFYPSYYSESVSPYYSLLSSPCTDSISFIITDSISNKYFVLNKRIMSYDPTSGYYYKIDNNAAKYVVIFSKNEFDKYEFGAFPLLIDEIKDNYFFFDNKDEGVIRFLLNSKFEVIQKLEID